MARRSTDGPAFSLSLSAEAQDFLKTTARLQKRTPSKIAEALVREHAAYLTRKSISEDPYLKTKISARRKHGSDTSELECALLNFVNLGECELALPSFSKAEWRLVALRCDSYLERAARAAFRLQLDALVAGKRPVLPTLPRWTRLGAVDPRRFGHVLWACRLFEDIVEAIAYGPHAPRVAVCAYCDGFMTNHKVPGPPKHFCVPEHQRAADATKSPGRVKRWRAITKEMKARRAAARARS